jgi:hypothetical protein
MTEQTIPAAQATAASQSAGWRYRYASPITRAFLLDDDVYAEYAFGPAPMSRGFKSLLAILGVVVLSQVFGWIFGLLTMPRLGGIQAAIYNFIVGLPWYANQAAASSGFVQQFQRTYGLVWEGLRTLLGQPTATSLISSVLALIVTTLVFWLVYAAFAQMLARWFGGAASYRQLAGALALSYAPLLILVVELWPGAIVPVTLMFPLLLVFKYLAIRRAHGLSSGYTLAATLGPYVIALVILAGLSLFGAALGLNSIPVLGDILRLGGEAPVIRF